MKKTMALLIAFSLLVLMLASCNSAAPTETPAAESAQASAGETPAATASPEQTPAESQQESPAASPESQAPEPAQSPETAPSTIFTGDEIAAPPNDMELPISGEVLSYDLFFSFPPPLAEKIDSLLNGPALEELTKRTNIQITFYSVSAAVASERYSIMLASGDFPDILQNLTENYTGGYDQAIEEGIIYDQMELIEDYIPIYAEVLNASEEIRLALTTTDGHIGGITRLYKEPSRSKNGNIIRQDWLDELGLGTPNTISELTDVLTAFKNEKGAAEPYYLSATGVSSNNAVIGAFGVVSGYYQEDGQVKFGAIESGFKDYLTTVSQWYAAGLVSSDYFSNTSYYPDNGDVAKGAIGVFLQEDSYLQDVYNYVDESGTTLKLGAIPAMIVNDGDVNHFGNGFGDWTGGTTWSISTNCENPEPLCHMINYLFTAEGSLLANYGVQGVSWEYDDAGKPHVTETITNNPEINNMEAQLKYTLPFALFIEDYSRFDTGYTEDQLQAPIIWQTNADKQNLLPTGLSMSTEYSDEYNPIYTDISTYVTENVGKFITGAKPLSEFDDYVAEVKAIGADRCVGIWQTLLDEYNNK